MSFWRPTEGGVRVAVKVQPKSRRPAVGGRAAGASGGRAPAIEGERLRIAVAEPAEDGRANRAVCEALAQALGLRSADVTVAQGASSRDKSLHVAGDPATIAPRLEAL